ncbi:MAG: SagB/ThcOx family dehydrogenase [Ignavibacteria bacterium]|nr:SagB/ThcOx family dehydrogenase [Ignavibacteria bacterium]
MKGLQKINLFVGLFLLALGVVVILLNPIKINGEENNMLVKEEIKLPNPKFSGTISLEEVLKKRRSVRSFKDEPITINDLSQLLWSVQGISDTSWGLRTAPSAGALYPLEIYVVVGNIKDLETGVYKYNPKTHSLQKVLSGDKRKELYNSALQQESIILAPVNFVIAGVFQRTAVKYGARAERYVYIEVGHAAQNLLLQATALNLGGVPIGAFYDERVKTILKFQQEEEPLYIIPIGKKY